MLYFAYGSNLNLRQMRRRCPGHRVVGPAVAEGWRLVFPRPCESWDGAGVAGIERADGRRVEGALYEVTAADEAALDRYEGIVDGEYTKRELTVTLPGGSVQVAMTYFATPVDPGHFPPSRRYLETILEGARDHRLSDEWVALLRSVQVAQTRPEGSDEPRP